MRHTFTSNEEAVGYLSAMIDGEGCVTYATQTQTGPARRIDIVNTDVGLIDACAAACKQLGMAYTVKCRGPRGNARALYCLSITRRLNLERAYSVLRLRSEAKATKLANAVSTYKVHQTSSDERPLDEVRRLYWEEGLTIDGVAAQLGREPQVISYWMRKAGIPRRTRGEAMRLHAERKISAEDIIALYVDRELGLDTTARKLGCSTPTLRRLMTHYGIKRRSRKEAMAIANARL